MKTLLKFIVGAVLLAPAAFLAIIWNYLPDQVPMHYNIEGEADRYGGKAELWFVVGFMSLISAICYLVLSNIHRLDPRKNYNQDNLQKMRTLALILAVFMSALMVSIIYEASRGGHSYGGTWVFVGIGLLFAVLGNYMYNLKSNYFIGIRLPWTLESESNWRATHRLAAPLWLCGGILIAVIALFFPLKVVLYSFGVIIFILVAAPVIYSGYLQFHNSKKKYSK